MHVTRIGLIQLISQLSTEECGALAKRINSAKIPAKWTRLFGPKVVAHPENLSLGEYEVFVTLALALLLHGTWDELCLIAKLSTEVTEFWVTLSEAFKELWDAMGNGRRYWARHYTT